VERYLTSFNEVILTYFLAQEPFHDFGFGGKVFDGKVFSGKVFSGKVFSVKVFSGKVFK
jgi:hypothetical protein